MTEPVFHYRIAPDARLANDDKGNYTFAYTRIELDCVGIKSENYDEVHERLKELVEEQMGIKAEYLKCISVEEYNENIEEDKE
jgi:hypothetical protein